MHVLEDVGDDLADHLVQARVVFGAEGPPSESAPAPRSCAVDTRSSVASNTLHTMTLSDQLSLAECKRI